MFRRKRNLTISFICLGVSFKEKCVELPKLSWKIYVHISLVQYYQTRSIISSDYYYCYSNFDWNIKLIVVFSTRMKIKLNKGTFSCNSTSKMPFQVAFSISNSNWLYSNVAYIHSNSNFTNSNVIQLLRWRKSIHKWAVGKKVEEKNNFNEKSIWTIWLLMKKCKLDTDTCRLQIDCIEQKWHMPNKHNYLK